MVGREENVVYLDTHVVIWLYDALTDRLSSTARSAIEQNDVRIAWVVKLEVQYLYEIGRVRVPAETVVESLSRSIGLRLSGVPCGEIVQRALEMEWTRDVFDRLIAAESEVTASGLVTKDARMKQNLETAIW